MIRYTLPQSSLDIRGHPFTGLWGKPLSACHVQSSAQDPQAAFRRNDEPLRTCSQDTLQQAAFQALTSCQSPESPPWHKKCCFTIRNLSGLRDGWKGIQRPFQKTVKSSVCMGIDIIFATTCMYVYNIVSEERIITMICTKSCDVLFSGLT